MVKAMDTKVKQLNKALKAHDRELFSRRESNGTINIYRRGVACQSCDLEGSRLLYSVPSPHFIFSLTEDFTVRGKPVDCGIEVVLSRLKAHDLWNREDLAEELIKSYEKEKESKERDRKNNVESFFYDFHSKFKKTFSDVNTSQMKRR